MANISKKCPKCQRKMVRRRNYAPSTGFLPGHTWTHIYDLSEVFSNPNLCKHIMEGR